MKFYNLTYFQIRYTEKPTDECGFTKLFSLVFERGGLLQAFENCHRHKSGSYRWLFWRAQPGLEERMLDEAAVDITDRKQALKIQKFVSLADNSGDLMKIRTSLLISFFLSVAGGTGRSRNSVPSVPSYQDRRSVVDDLKRLLY